MADVASLLPPGSRRIEYDLEQFPARLDGLDDPVKSLWSADDIRADLLGYLAWAFSVDVWDNTWSEPTRRVVVKNSVGVHRIKGTARAVDIALAGIGMEARIYEWFEYGGRPHTFIVDAIANVVFDAGFEIGDELAETVRAVIDSVRPVRAHYDFRIGERFLNPVFPRAARRQSGVDRSGLSAGVPVFRFSADPALAAGAVRSSGRDRAVLDIMTGG